jgi:predicted HTH domain antitoxin
MFELDGSDNGENMGLLQIQPENLVEAKIYPNETEVIQAAMQYLLQNRPEVRIALAVYQYQTDEQLSLARAAAIAGVSSERMKEILVARGVELRLGPATIEDAAMEVAQMGEWFDTHTY